MPEDAKSLAAVIEAAMDPIEKAFSDVLEGVHKHGALEEREAVAQWLVIQERDALNAGDTRAAGLILELKKSIEAGEHRQ